MVIKYVIVVSISVVIVRMVRWANRGCSTITAGVITALISFLVNALINWALKKAWTCWILSICEAVLVCGVTVLLLDLLYMIKHARRYKRVPPPCCNRGRAEAFSSAMGELSQTFSDVAEASEATDVRVAEFRMIMANQLEAMTKIVKEWSNPPVGVDFRFKNQLAKLALETKSHKIVMEDAHCFLENEHVLVQAYVSSKYQEVVSSKEYLACLKRAFGFGMSLEKNAPNVLGVDPVLISAYEEPPYYTLFGMAMQNKRGSVLSGDSFSILEKDDKTTHICLSDGMGSGKKASEESQLVIHLMEKLLDAGFSKDAALELLNSAMVVCTSEDAYATLDYAYINLYEGILELTKIGAAASFIKRDDRVEIVRSADPPAGASAVLQVEPISKVLENGDFLVMVTDGVIEYLMEEEPEEYLAELISNINTENASVFAKRLLEMALAKAGGYAMDDMTVLVAGIWRK